VQLNFQQLFLNSLLLSSYCFKESHFSTIFRSTLNHISQMIGIVGGVGPYAGLDLVRKLFNNTLAGSDQEHLDVVMISMPGSIPERTEYLLGRVKENPGRAIADWRRLVASGQLERFSARELDLRFRGNAVLVGVGEL